jgi:ABC-type branched-subunit amino acid transport system permease subunit
LKAGLISGVVWGALISLVQFLQVETSYSTYLNAYSQLLAGNSTSLSCSSPSQCISFGLELNTTVALVLGVGIGAVIGLSFGWLALRILQKQSYAVKAILISIFFWVLYQVAIVPLPDPFEIASSLAISLFAGYLLAYFYRRFVGAPPNLVGGDASTSSFSEARR